MPILTFFQRVRQGLGARTPPADGPQTADVGPPTGVGDPRRCSEPDGVTWLTVMTLANGTSVEMAMPSPGMRHDMHAYRVSGADGVTEHSALTGAASRVIELSGSKTPEASSRVSPPDPQ